jgi:hypothetical protein
MYEPVVLRVVTGTIRVSNNVYLGTLDLASGIAALQPCSRGV